MGFTKHDSETLKKASDNEPIFVLRAQDMLAPEIIRYWAGRVQAGGMLCSDKYKEAMAIAKAMEEWSERKMPD